MSKDVEAKVEEKAEVKVELLDFEQLRKARRKISTSMKDVWSSEDLKPVRSNLEEVGRAISKPYSRVAEESGFAQMLAEEAEKLDLPGLMRSAWGTKAPEKS